MMTILKAFDGEQTGLTPPCFEEKIRWRGIENDKPNMLDFAVDGVVMEDETPYDELVRLRKAQINALQNEIYGGLSRAEKAEYNRRAERIRELEEGVTEKP
jgi:hypothetical protein